MSDYTPYQAHSDTSKEASGQIKDAVISLKQKVLDYIVSRGSDGATDEEIQHSLGMNPNTQRPRRVDLVREKRVVDSGFRRLTANKRKAVVWTAAQFAVVKFYASLEEYFAEENAGRSGEVRPG